MLARSLIFLFLFCRITEDGFTAWSGVSSHYGPKTGSGIVLPGSYPKWNKWNNCGNWWKRKKNKMLIEKAKKERDGIEDKNKTEQLMFPLATANWEVGKTVIFFFSTRSNAIKPSQPIITSRCLLRLWPPPFPSAIGNTGAFALDRSQAASGSCATNNSTTWKCLRAATYSPFYNIASSFCMLLSRTWIWTNEVIWCEQVKCRLRMHMQT